MPPPRRHGLESQNHWKSAQTLIFHEERSLGPRSPQYSAALFSTVLYTVLRTGLPHLVVLVRPNLELLA